jgi:hypothetical protein
MLGVRLTHQEPTGERDQAAAFVPEHILLRHEMNVPSHDSPFPIEKIFLTFSHRFKKMQDAR